MTDLVTDLASLAQGRAPSGATHRLGAALWTSERAESLKTMWADGMSATECAMELGGITRNAVLGKVHRMGLSQRRAFSSRRPERSARLPAPFKPKPERIKREARDRVLAPPAIEPDPVLDLPSDFSEFACTFSDLQPHQCKWPMGDPCTSEFQFCGDKRLVEADLPYCKRHARLAYNHPHKITEADRERRRRHAYRNIVAGKFHPDLKGRVE